jgi:hypothetical protein
VLGARPTLVLLEGVPSIYNPLPTGVAPETTPPVFNPATLNVNPPTQCNLGQVWKMREIININNILWFIYIYIYIYL